MAVELGWLYGTLGLIGFLAQIVVGIQGRLLPMHGWYRAFEAGGMQPPARSVHTLAHPLADAIDLPDVDARCALTRHRAGCSEHPVIATGSALLLAGVVLNAVQAYHVATGASRVRG